MFNKSSNVYILLTVVVAILFKYTCQQQPNVNSNANSNSNRNRVSNCLRGDCYPETGDLLIGRTKFLHASSTCGLTQPERYCVLGTTRDATKCFVCDSSEPYDSYRNLNSHTIENIVSRKQGDRFNRWWQSENGKQSVFIQFDLEAEFAFTHIIMTFKTFRPAAMVIEKSSDFGREWKTHGYFASNCAESFPGISTDLPKNLGDVYCESKYSSETPSTKGEIVFRILPPTLIQSRDPYSAEIQDLLKITNLRVNFTKLHTFGDNLLDPREDLKEKYYYSLYEMVVRGSCLCYGHASRCIPVEGVQYDLDKTGMVDGQCQCQHNTWGTNCEKCLPLFNDRPWMPARSGQANECRRCQCNNHARSCRFDQSLFESTNGSTGGICDDCQHNTEGYNCEKCKIDYWRDPNRPIDDIFTCKKCLCDKSGSLNDAKCDPVTDVEQGLIAGRCHCKELVEGDNCEKCKNGYFNLTKENPIGCEPCSCNLIGTTGNLGCDKITGLCECKQFVTGRACDQCLPGYFGLSADDPNGCKPCACSLGGSVDASCDLETGECKCRKNMVGRTCEKPESGYYCPTLDHLIYEAESAVKANERAQDYIRQYNPEYKPSWTGSGYVRVFEGASLEFNIDNIFKAGDYELVIRYEYLQNAESWEDLRISIVRLDNQDSSLDFCEKSQDDNIGTSLPSNSNYKVVVPPFCLESKNRYKLILDFVRFSSTGQTREASILIDSILLIPSIDDLPALQGNDSDALKDDFRYHRCRESQLNIYKDDLNPNCAKFICNIGVHNDYALECNCDQAGSLSSICDPFGGMCTCKPNVVGQKCDKCAPGTWEFGSNGCQPCNCNAAGAKNNFCNLETGQCDCYDKIEGLKCDTCMDNHWRFPACEQCNCNGFADTCNKTSGQCINCRDHTYGYNCENCEDGFYGRPTSGQACKECMCPGGILGNQFASTCYFDQRIDSVVCNCQEGYIGAKCDKCAPHYFGNPLVRGGSCTKCECNGNVDMNDPYSCDQSNGKCVNCLYYTDGDHCEKCKPGYFGNASNHECRPCNCNPEGTEGKSALNCDQTTGECNCLPNVVGRYCDQCKADHYGLSSGEDGCDSCNCDTDGTVNNSTRCDLITGQCDCLNSRGGRTCSECSYGYWGDPNKECRKCECYGAGSLSDQCDKINGSCQCRKGIRGHNCDTCDRGTTGNVPFCKQCGECFDDWNKITNDLKNDLEKLEEDASNMAVASGSSVKDFTSEYAMLEDKLNDIRKLIPLNYTDRQLKMLNELMQNINKQLDGKKKSREKYYDIEKWTQENPQNHLDDSRASFKAIQEETESLTQQAMDLKESHETGAIDSINKASRQSSEAQYQLDSVDSKLNSEFRPILNKLKQKIDVSKEKLQKTDDLLKTYFGNIMNNLTVSENGIFGLNEAVCGGSTNEKQKCNAKCGGALCDGKCGSNSSSCSSLMDSYLNLLNVRKGFEDLFGEKELVFKRILTKIINSSNIVNNVNKDINGLMEYAKKSFDSIDTKQKDLTNLIEQVQNSLNNYNIKPNKIEADCKFASELVVDLKQEELEEIISKSRDLASRINVNNLETESETTLSKINNLLANSDQIASFLPDLTMKYNKTSESIDKETNRTQLVEANLNELEKNNLNFINDLKSSGEKLNESEASIKALDKHMSDLQGTVDLNTIKDKTAKMLAKQESFKSKVKESGVTLERTKNNLDTLKTKLEELTRAFQGFIKNKDNDKDTDMLNTLINLQANIINKKNVIDQKTSKIGRLQKNYDETRVRINELKNIISSLKSKAMNIKADIQSKEKFFNSCS